ncbi:MAG: pimeloyl-ACP methyl esterase BioG family protein [Bacteroidales bacterium]
MKTYIRRREKNNNLVVLYGGWGTDENVFIPLCNDEFDFILFYNYSADEALVLPEMKTYKKITLIGWSLGVWAAEYLSSRTGIRPDITIAVNGTPVPADDQYGIPLNVFEGTLNNITEGNINKFYLRMFGDKKSYQTNIDRVPHRTLKSLHDELRWMYNRIMEQKESGFIWDYAVTSEIDRVFPSKNLEGYWEKEINTKHIVLQLPHYLFNEWKSFPDFISFVENYKVNKSKLKKVHINKTKGL